MKISILTLFPRCLISPLKYSLIGKAIEREIIQVDVINLRHYALTNINRLMITLTAAAPAWSLRLMWH